MAGLILPHLEGVECSCLLVVVVRRAETTSAIFHRRPEADRQKPTRLRRSDDRCVAADGRKSRPLPAFKTKKQAFVEAQALVQK